jgi:CheY-like chemotaxis protein
MVGGLDHRDQETDRRAAPRGASNGERARIVETPEEAVPEIGMGAANHARHAGNSALVASSAKRIEGLAMSSAANKQPLPARRVLVIEDDHDIREALGAVLTGEGFEVTACAHGREALEWLERTGVVPAAIVLDLMMPVMNGWQFLAQCRREGPLAQVPVIVLSAHAGFDDVKVSADACFRKPIRLDDLLAALHRLT